MVSRILFAVYCYLHDKSVSITRMADKKVITFSKHNNGNV